MDQVKAIVYDQASNMELTGRTLEEESECENLSCAAHRLQLCINEGLEINAVSWAIGNWSLTFTIVPLPLQSFRSIRKQWGCHLKGSNRTAQHAGTALTIIMVQSLLAAVLSDETISLSGSVF